MVGFIQHLARQPCGTNYLAVSVLLVSVFVSVVVVLVVFFLVLVLFFGFVVSVVVVAELDSEEALLPFFAVLVLLSWVIANVNGTNNIPRNNIVASFFIFSVPPWWAACYHPPDRNMRLWQELDNSLYRLACYTEAGDRKVPGKNFRHRCNIFLLQEVPVSERPGHPLNSYSDLALNEGISHLKG